jgi:short-subunit dehydrogenase
MDRRLALVTGASAGIGAAFAKIYASHGYDVALTARRADRLEALAEEIRLRSGVETYAIADDLADPAAVERILAEIEAQGRVVDALVNNAGYGVHGAYDATDWETQSRLQQVLVTAVAELTHKVLPGMVERRFGRIVNVASVAGLLPGSPGAALYSPAKAYLARFSQGLHMEVREHGVHVSALCPGFTYSEFHDVNGARERISRAIPAWMWMGADEVAAAGYEAAEANRPLCVPGVHNQVLAAFAKLMPDEWTMALTKSRLGRFRGL